MQENARLAEAPIVAWLATSDNQWMILVPKGVSRELIIVHQESRMTCIIQFGDRYADLVARYHAHEGSEMVRNEFDEQTNATIKSIVNSAQQYRSCYAQFLECSKPTALVLKNMPRIGVQDALLIRAHVDPVSVNLALGSSMLPTSSISEGFCFILDRGAKLIIKASANRAVFQIESRAVLATWANSCILILPICSPDVLSKRLENAKLDSVGSYPTLRKIADGIITDRGGNTHETNSIDLASYALCDTGAVRRSCVRDR